MDHVKGYDGTIESQIAIEQERNELGIKFSVAMHKLNEALSEAQIIAADLHDNGLLWCGKSEDGDYRRIHALERDDMLQDISEYSR